MTTIEVLLKNFSLKTKIILIICLVSLLTLFCLLATMLYSQHKILHKALLDEVNIIAVDVSGSLAAALIFEDQEQVDAVLESIFSKQQILYAQIDWGNDEPQRYINPAAAESPHSGLVNGIVPVKRHLFGENLELWQPLTHKDELLGSLYLQVGLKQIRTTLMYYALFGLVGLIGSALLGIFLALKLQKIISSPIEQLALIMNSVSADQDYSRRVANNRGDEMGVLIDNFNNMLCQIEVRDQELSSQRVYLDHLAYHDFLTGLPNRLLFRDRLASALSRSKRTNRKIGLFFLDLDRFKIINDTLGHDVGDVVLKMVTQRLQDWIREEDTLARLGGDEFVVIVEEVQDQRSLSLVAEKLLQALAQAFVVEDRELYISASIGGTLYPDDAETVEGLMKCADVAMYRAKAAGRSRFSFYAVEMDQEAGEAHFLENNMRNALLNEEFELYFQPQIDLHTSAVLGMEALIRWQHPTLGLLPPCRFIPLAEESDLILAIGRWVLETACVQATTWQQSGSAPCTVAINISPKQFYHADLCQTVDEVLRMTGLDANLLQLEITETVIMADMEKATETMHQLVALGVRLVLDDFGTGYSSLSCLERFPISSLKIDRSFLARVQPGQTSGVLAEAIIALGKSLRLDVVAEGVETEYQRSFLKRRGCRIGQGFYLSRPIQAEECCSFLEGEAIVSGFIADVSEPLNDTPQVDKKKGKKSFMGLPGVPVF
jgi:diguanylate cyclase (GGDEF)-like protein